MFQMTLFLHSYISNSSFKSITEITAQEVWYQQACQDNTSSAVISVVHKSKWVLLTNLY